MKKVLVIILNKILLLFKVKKNKLLFQSGRSKIDCAPYAIYRYIKNNCPSDFCCIWLVDRDADVSNLEKGDYCYYNSLRGLIALATSKYWIRSQSIGSVVKKKNNQVYIQTWHGAGNLKKCGYDCDNIKRKSLPVMDHVKEWDWLIATDKYNEEVLRSSTGFNKNSIVLGNADTDILIERNTNSYRKSVLKELGINKKYNKIVMYAPTFRDFDLDSNEKLNIPVLKLSELDDYLILLRLHPLVCDKISDLQLPDNFIDVGWYSNILNLYLITDVLITDYSSIIFPYMLLEKPLIMYPYDYERYIDLRGGFYLDYEKDIPAPIVRSETDLVDAVKDINKTWKEYSSKVKKFNKKYNNLNNGTVCERIVSELKKGTFE